MRTPQTNRVFQLGKGHGFTENLHTNINGTGQHVIATAVDPNVVKGELIPIAKAIADNKAEHDSSFYPVRIIPEHVMDRAFREGAFNDKAWWKRWANSEEGRLFGIERNGRIPKL